MPILLISFVLLLIYMTFVEPNLLRVNNITINEGPNLKVALFADTHFGALYSPKNVEKVVAEINEQNPDIVFFVGDLIDDYERDFKNLDLDYLKQELSKINVPKYAVRGNHDIGGGMEYLYTDFLTQAGFIVLINESVYIEELDTYIHGYDDRRWGKKVPEFYEHNNESYNIFLMHEPDDADNITGNANGLVLSGHTHGGQINIPLLTRFVLPTGGQKYVRGMYEDINGNDGLDVFTTIGVGATGLPMRLFAVPEIVVIDFGEY